MDNIKLYSECEDYKLFNGNMLDLGSVIKSKSVNAVVCDPPYELGFMGKRWDSMGVAFDKDTWRKCYDVLKPGGYLLAFGGSRTFHRIACAIEDAGFEIRDTVMWLYGCLSEDTEVLTDNGFKRYHKITEDDKILIYDNTRNIYKWEKPQRWSAYNIEQDTCYSIKSDETDQIVSRNHRCLVERDGKLVFEFAENLSEMERVPVLSQDFLVMEEERGSLLQSSLCSSYKSQCRGQQDRESYAIQEQQRAQEIRGGTKYQTTLATIKPIEYSGVIFCPTVSTGAFVARRNGKIFITGNSGFPKSMNIGLAIDKKNGVASEVVGKGKSGSADTHTRCMHSQTKDGKDVFGGEYEIKKAKNKWDGWGTALKPAYEPIIVARKPFKGSLIDNVRRFGVGGLNIDECRIETNDDLNGGCYRGKNTKQPTDATSHYIKSPKIDGREFVSPSGRFPANVILDSQDGEDWRRYFYCAKASKKDRDEGLDDFAEKQMYYCDGRSNSLEIFGSTDGGRLPRKNTHPTVKPTSLMQYLVRLVTPKGGTVLDPFMGSGSTGKAVMYENNERDAKYKFVGIELSEDYMKIAEARIAYARKKGDKENG